MNDRSQEISVPESVTVSLDALIEWVREQGDPVSQALAWASAFAALKEAQGALAQLRAGAVRQLSAEQWTQREIARALGIDGALVNRILHSD